MPQHSDPFALQNDSLTAGTPAQRGFATMSDVAQLAGVSLKSVSRVVNNEAHISAKLRTRVEAAIQQLDYVPDTAARSLAGARSFTLGVFFNNSSPNYTMKVVAGVYAACIEHKYHLRIDNIDTYAAPDVLEGQLDQILRHSRVDGLVLTPPITDNAQVLDYLEARGVAYTRISPTLTPERSAHTWIDNAAAGAQIAEYLWARGHRRFGMATGNINHGDASQRREGFANRLRQFDPSVVIIEAYGGYLFENGIAAGHELLGAKRHPTAIFAANDDSAAGVMVAARELGLEIPRDVSIVGFDDSWVAKSVWPYLTTIHQPIEAMAKAAARMLLDRDKLAGKHAEKLDYTLIERDSVADAP